LHDALGRLVVYTLQDIKQGQEVTISYVAGGLTCSLDMRSGFVSGVLNGQSCMCSRCKRELLDPSCTLTQDQRGSRIAHAFSEVFGPPFRSKCMEFVNRQGNITMIPASTLVHVQEQYANVLEDAFHCSNMLEQVTQLDPYAYALFFEKLAPVLLYGGHYSQDRVLCDSMMPLFVRFLINIPQSAKYMPANWAMTQALAMFSVLKLHTSQPLDRLTSFEALCMVTEDDMFETLKNTKFVEWVQKQAIKGHCYGCYKTQVSMLQCGKCRQRTYCSKTCQVSDWKLIHKLECQSSSS
jgi:hypothetical protein